MKRKMQGVSLLDLMTVLAVLAVILSIASPVGNWLAQQQLRSAHSEILLSINYARHLALSTGSPVTVCPLHGGDKCKTPWQGDLTIFVDPNRALALGEPAGVRKVVKIPAAIQVQWRGMNPTSSIRFTPTGLTFVSNGTFTVSHSSLEQSKKIIINRQGRARTE